MRCILLLLVFAFACPSSESEGSEGSAGTEEEIVIDPQPEEDPEPEDPEPADDSNLVVGDDPCEVDADCVKATCCHAAACVAVANGPDCTDQMCTADCQFGTTDCGGGCLCHEGRCAARLSEQPEIQ